MHTGSWNRRPLIRVCLALLLAACGGDGPTTPGDTGTGPTEPVHGDPGLHVMLGAGVTDTIDAELPQALVVEVRRADGLVATGAVVRFEAQPPADTSRRHEAVVSLCSVKASPCSLDSRLQFAVDTTNADGRARIIVRMGQAAGHGVVRLTVPELALADSATYTVLPGAAARVRAVSADTVLTISDAANLRGHVTDRYYNIRSETPTATVGSGTSLSVDAATGVVTAEDMGTQWLFMRYQSAIDSTSVRVLPTGRLIVWSSYEATVRLVNLDFSEARTVATGVASDLGAFPHFDATRHTITLSHGPDAGGGEPNSVMVIDTTGSPRRDLGPTVGFGNVLTTRQLADGTLLVVASTDSGLPCAGFALLRVEADNSLTCLAALSGLGAVYGGADISHDGTRVAYIHTDPSLPNSSVHDLRVLDVATGATTVLESNASSPRWSADDKRVAYLLPTPGALNGADGPAVVINADGAERHTLGSFVFSPGLAWSPDGVFIVGRNSDNSQIGLRVIRVSDGAQVLLRARTSTGSDVDYYQPDWR